MDKPQLAPLLKARGYVRTASIPKGIPHPAVPFFYRSPTYGTTVADEEGNGWMSMRCESLEDLNIREIPRPTMNFRAIDAH